MVLPKFSEGISTVKVYLLTTYFATLASQASTFLTALHKQGRLIIISFIAILLNVSLCLLAINRGFGILGVAWATSTTSALFFIVLYAYAMGQVQGKIATIHDLTKILGPLLFSGLLLGWMDSRTWVSQNLVDATVKAMVYYLGMIPFVIALNRETNILGKLYETVAVKKKAKDQGAPFEKKD
jgi:O-antigen/teichoic acid export membrane protein